jgi:hypothetical protein
MIDGFVPSIRATLKPDAYDPHSRSTSARSVQA